MTDWPFAPLVPLKYGVILADPPWQYEMRSDKGYEKSPESHYETMPVEEIKALPVGHLASRDCYLFLWSTWPHLGQAMDVMSAWGFTYITGGSWLKRTVNWKMAFGTGFVLRSSTEPFLVGRVGAPQPQSARERNVIIAPEFTIEPEDVADSIEAVRREHSRKPIQMRQMIERLCPRQYCVELFGREPWAGNDVWGNQTNKFAEVMSG